MAADRSVEERIADRLDAAARTALDGLLSETLQTRVTRFVWLRQFEPGNNAAVAGRLLDRLEFLQRLGLSERIIEDIPSHRVTRLRRQGERHFADGLREMLDSRRLAILAVCAVEWQAGVADTLIETHDRIVGRILARGCQALRRPYRRRQDSSLPDAEVFRRPRWGAA